MVLNYLRFGNILEFGHNYLPEFLSAENGQFSTAYVKNNFKMLIHLPEISDNGMTIIDHFGNLNFLIVNPVILFSLIAVLLLAIRKKGKEVLFSVMVLTLSAAYLFVLLMYRTMGGWHFGNRYTNDIIPWQCILLCLGLKEREHLAKWQVPLAVMGICVNVIGTVAVYNG